MVGFSFYSFEGIGTVMPIRACTKYPEMFPKILTISLITLGTLFVIFGMICYMYFGHMEQKFVIYNLDQTNNFIKVTELAFCVNLVLSYPLCIFPTNKILEGFLFSCMNKNTPLRKWLKNLSRTVVCILGCSISILFMDYLDQFLGVSGAILGVTVILIVPTLCHYKLLAETKQQKILDIFVIMLSIAILGLCSYNGIKAWVKDE